MWWTGHIEYKGTKVHCVHSFGWNIEWFKNPCAHVRISDTHMHHVGQGERERLDFIVPQEGPMACVCEQTN